MRSSSGILSTSIDFNLLHHLGNGMPPEAIDTTKTRHLKYYKYFMFFLGTIRDLKQTNSRHDKS